MVFARFCWHGRHGRPSCQQSHFAGMETGRKKPPAYQRQPRIPCQHASMPALLFKLFVKMGGGIYSYPASQEGKNTMDKPQDFRYWWQSPDIEPIKKRATESDYCCCGQRIMHSRTGRPREFCSNRCKQRAYRIREALRKLRISGGLVT